MSREVTILTSLLVMLAALALAAPGFFQPVNLRDVALSNLSVLVAAIGMTAVILIRQIDVSIGAQFAVCGIAAGVLAKTGLPMPLVALATLLGGALLGSVNGALVAFGNLPSIVVTLGAMAIWRETIRWATGGAWIQDLPASFQWFGQSQQSGEWILALSTFVLFAACAWTLRFLRAGRALYATGSDAEAARLAGLNTRAITFAAFGILGALTGLAALLDSVRFTEIQSNAGMGFELKVIAAVVVGGTSVNGGRGTLIGTLLGVIILGIIGPALTFLGVNAFWEKAVQGAIILCAVMLDAVWARTGKHALAH